MVFAFFLIWLVCLPFMICASCLYLVRKRYYKLTSLAVAAAIALCWAIHYRLILSGAPASDADLQWHIVYMDVIIVSCACALIALPLIAFSIQQRQYYRQYAGVDGSAP